MQAVTEFLVEQLMNQPGPCHSRLSLEGRRNHQHIIMCLPPGPRPGVPGVPGAVVHDLDQVGRQGLAECGFDSLGAALRLHR